MPPTPPTPHPTPPHPTPPRRSFDANLVSPGRPNPLPSIRDPPEMKHGMAHCLVNNMWGTNYVMVRGHVCKHCAQWCGP